MKNKFLSIISLLLMLVILVSCGGATSDSPSDSQSQETLQTQATADCAMINGNKLENFTIVYSDSTNDYDKRAAEYIQQQIKLRTSLELDVVTDKAAASEYEIIVGQTNREISKSLNASTDGIQFSIMANDKQVAIEGKHFVIAAAAYFFVETYIPADKFNSSIPTEATLHEPITETPKNYIFLIGDGMGVYQTKLFDVMDIPKSNNYSDNEDLFYGYMLPHQGFAKTYSLSGITDSAAAGTALATGYKTTNEMVGINRGRKEVQSLTELAGSLGMSTAIMSTDVQTGATPAAFSAHALTRELTAAITKSQNELIETYGTTITCDFPHCVPIKVSALEKEVVETIDKLDDNEKGFFMMFEEGYIDKSSHNNDLTLTFLNILRFNQIIGRVMEYALYNPDTFVIITADHETGDLRPDASGNFKFNSENHSGADVPVFAYGEGAQLFDNKTIDNVQIPKTIAKFWGIASFGDKALAPALN